MFGLQVRSESKKSLRLERARVSSPKPLRSAPLGASSVIFMPHNFHPVGSLGLKWPSPFLLSTSCSCYSPCEYLETGMAKESWGNEFKKSLPLPLKLGKADLYEKKYWNGTASYDPCPSGPQPAFCLWKNFSQRIKLIREVGKCRNKGKQWKETKWEQCSH